MRYRFLSCLLLLTLPVGCSRIQKTRECRRFATLVNASLADIEAQLKPRSSASFRAGAAGYKKLAATLRADKSAPGELLAEEFAQAFESAASAATSLADGLDAKDQRKQDDARRELDRLSRQEQSLVLRTNAHCESP